jgi:hypothetical protein
VAAGFLCTAAVAVQLSVAGLCCCHSIIQPTAAGPSTALTIEDVDSVCTGVTIQFKPAVQEERQCHLCAELTRMRYCLGVPGWYCCFCQPVPAANSTWQGCPVVKQCRW